MLLPAALYAPGCKFFGNALGTQALEWPCISGNPLKHLDKVADTCNLDIDVIHFMQVFSV